MKLQFARSLALNAVSCFCKLQMYAYQNSAVVVNIFCFVSINSYKVTIEQRQQISDFCAYMMIFSCPCSYNC